MLKDLFLLNPALCIDKTVVRVYSKTANKRALGYDVEDQKIGDKSYFSTSQHLRAPPNRPFKSLPMLFLWKKIITEFQQLAVGVKTNQFH